MSYPPDDERFAALARYLAGECTPSETARIQRLLAEEPDRAKAMAALAGMMNRLEPPPMAPVDVDGAWDRIRHRMRVIEAPAPEPEPAIDAPQRETEVVPAPVAASLIEAMIDVVEPAPEPESPVAEAVIDVVEPVQEPEAPLLEAATEVMDTAPEPEAPLLEAATEVMDTAPEPEAPLLEAAAEVMDTAPEPEAPASRAPWWNAAVRAAAALWKWVRGGR